jgi:hypothetical protein
MKIRTFYFNLQLSVDVNETDNFQQDSDQAFKVLRTFEKVLPKDINVHDVEVASESDVWGYDPKYKVGDVKD